MGNQAAGVLRLGLPTYQWWTEALHGIVFWEESHLQDGSFGTATSFSQPINLGAAFDDELVFDIASVISTEERAFGNAGRAGVDVWVSIFVSR